MMGPLAQWFLKMAQRDDIQINEEAFLRAIDGPQPDMEIPDLPRFCKAYCAAAVSFVNELGWSTESVFLRDSAQRRQAETFVRCVCRDYHLLGGEVICVQQTLVNMHKARIWRQWTRAMARLLGAQWDNHVIDLRKDLSSRTAGHNGNNGDHVAAAQLAAEHFSSAVSGNGADPA